MIYITQHAQLPAIADSWMLVNMPRLFNTKQQDNTQKSQR